VRTIRKHINYGDEHNDENEYRCESIANQIYILNPKTITAVEID